MPAHQRVCAWIAQNYQKPAIDQEWLADCSDWLSSELGLDPVRDFDQFIQNVEAQLLQSNLADSTVPGSGIDPLLVTSNPGQARPRLSNARRPGRQAPRQKKTTGPTSLLVEVKGITEIAHSAFNLLNTYQTRFDRADLGLAHEENAEQHPDEDDGPVPRFPRGMLRFELSDGLTAFRAIEFRSLPQLELGTTPLGYKMFLKSTPIRNGIAFLEPSNVTLKGYRTEDHDVNREQVFLSSLTKRLGHPDSPPEEPAAAQPRSNPPEQAPAQPARQHRPPPAAQPPPQPADIDDMYVDDDVDPDVLHEVAMQMEAINKQENQRVSNHAPLPAGPPPTSKEKPVTSSNSKQTLRVNTTVVSPSLNTPSPSSVKTSPYFTARSSEFNPIPDIGLSPRPAAPSDLEPNSDIIWDMDDPDPSALPVKIDSTSARLPPSVPVKRQTSPDPYDDLLSDMDESLLEQVGMIEQGYVASGADNKGKAKAKDIRGEGRPSIASAKKTSSGSALGTECLAICPVSHSCAEPSTRMQSSSKRSASTTSLSTSTKSAMPQSTQLRDRRLSRDPSLIVISSSEDEALGGRDLATPLAVAWRCANKRRKTDQEEVTDSDVIDISD